jgi:hypothetical protein
VNREKSDQATNVRTDQFRSHNKRLPKSRKKRSKAIQSCLLLSLKSSLRCRHVLFQQNCLTPRSTSVAATCELNQSCAHLATAFMAEKTAIVQPYTTSWAKIANCQSKPKLILSSETFTCLCSHNATSSQLLQTSRPWKDSESSKKCFKQTKRAMRPCSDLDS